MKINPENSCKMVRYGHVNVFVLCMCFRAKAEDDYSKSLLRSCKSLPDTVDTG